MSNAGTAGSDDTVSVQPERIGDALLITLARSSALNALTASMVDELDTVLRNGEQAGLKVVVLRSASPKAFSAGGDIRAIRAHALVGDAVSSEHFFSTEYRLNHRIAGYPVPFVSLVDGICMGGGMGLSIHGSFRVVTERAKLAMPETGIGFFPDVGASFFVPRLPGALGRYLGLTGAHITTADALYAGLATHYVHSTSLDDLLVRLLDSRDVPVDEVLNRCAGTSPVAHSQLVSNRGEIDWCFGTGDLHTIYHRLAASDSQWAHEIRRTLASLVPAESADHHRTAVVGTAAHTCTVALTPNCDSPDGDKVDSYIDAGEADGAKIVVDGRHVAGEAGSERDPASFWLGPTLIDHVTPEMSVYTDEIFGPVLSVVRVETYDEALELINSNPYGNGTVIFTNDGAAARRFQNEVEVGMIGINVPIPVPMAYYSFGGWKNSLFGDTHAHGTEGVHFFTRAKAITSRWLDHRAPGAQSGTSHGGIELGFPQNK
jgi:enoyl-CoA hydratase/carnithine racemase